MSSAADRSETVVVGSASVSGDDTQRPPRSPEPLFGSAVLRITARLASSLMLGVFLLLLARHMSVAEFGHYILAYTLGMAAGLTVGLGVPVQVMRIGAAGGPAAAAHMYLFHTVAVTAVFALGVLALGASNAPAMLLAGGVFAFSDTLQNYAQSHLAGVQAHLAASVLVVMQRAIPLIGCVVVLALGGSFDAVTFSVLFALTAAAAVLAPMLASERSHLRDALRLFRGRPPTKSASYWALSISGVLSQLQVATFALFASTLAVGYFSMATRVTGPLTLLAAAMSTVFIPELANRIANPPAFRSLYRRYLQITVAYCFVVTMVAWPVSWVVIQVVGSKYEPARMMLAGMVVAAGLSSVSQSISARYIAFGWPRTATVAIVAGGTTTLALLALAGSTGHIEDVWIVPIIGQLVVLLLMVSGRKGGHRR